MLAEAAKDRQQAPARSTLRVCTVSEGLESVLRLAEYMSRIESRISRTDLHLSEALAWLQNHSGDEFDLLLIAPEDQRDAQPHMVQAVLDLAMLKSARQIVLLPLKSRLNISADDSARVIYGPPFLEIDAITGVPTAAIPKQPAVPALETTAAPVGRVRSFLRLPWRRSGRSDDRPEPVPPAQLKVMAFQSMAGGAGATTLAINTAFQLAQGKSDLNVCLLDLNLQFGNVATYLDIPPSSKVLDAYRNVRKLDADAFQTCLHAATNNLAVFAAPGEMLPFDAMTGSEAQQIISLARASFDVVIIDLPHVVADWSGGVYSECDRVHSVSNLDVRSAQNTRKFLALLRSESVAQSKLFHVLNRVPARRSKRWKEHCKVFERGLGSAFGWQVPEGGEDVTDSCDAGRALVQAKPGNPVAAAVRNYCNSIRLLVNSQQTPASGG